MRKFVFSSILSIFLIPVLQAQDIAEHALGLRFGGNNGLGAEVSYQHALSDNNRLEADLGWRGDHHVTAVKLTGIYQWVWNLDQGLNWYAGAGGGLGSASYDTGYGNPKYRDGNQFIVFAAGDIGLEYNFDFPLLLSLDFRPEIGSSDYIDGLDFDIALGVRYQF